MSSDVGTASRPGQLVGNRLALIGAIVYLLEWVGIAAARTGVPAGPGHTGITSSQVVALYAGHYGGVAFLATWLSLVLLGRIAFATALRSALRRSGADSVLLDFAVGAMAASVILEISAFAVAAGAAQVANTGGNPDMVVALDAAANWLDLVIIAPLGVFLLCSALAMLWSGFFPRWISWLGIACGVAGTLLGVLIGPAFVAGGTFFSAVSVLNLSVLGFWVWMLATGIVLFRRA
ncbi:MAG TPA: hypothetical protein VGU71_10395 [Candidatus Dormibacteraeota bacterium]|nr:hypothetical protein [Candidatus Dormibacteraeota bacterium]